MMRRWMICLLLLASCGAPDCDESYPYRNEAILCTAMTQRLAPGDYATCPGGRLRQQGEYSHCECPPFAPVTP